VLVHVLPGVIEADSRVAAVYLEREFVPPQVRAFVDVVAAWAAQDLDPLDFHVSHAGVPPSTTRRAKSASPKRRTKRAKK
jgi:hypothetical protein